MFSSFDLVKSLNMLMGTHAYTPTLNCEWEKVLAEIHKISSARLAYNKELNQFYRESSLQEFEEFYRTVVINYNHTKFTGEEIDQDLISDKNYMVSYTADFISFYENIEKIISKRPYTQKMIDELHFLFNNEYIKKNEIEKYEVLKKAFQQSIHECNFLRGALNELEPIVSEIQNNYKNDYSFTFEPMTQTKIKMFLKAVNRKSHLTQKLDRLMEEFGAACLFLIQEWSEMHGKDESYNILFTICEAGMDVVKMQRGRLQQAVDRGPENINNIWQRYQETYAEYLDMLAMLKLCREHPFLSSTHKKNQEQNHEGGVSKNSKKNQKRRQKLKDSKKIIVTKEEEVIDHVVKLEPVESVEPEKSVQSPTFALQSEEVDLQKLRIQAWKRKVEQFQMEKQRARMRDRREEDLRSEESKKTQEEFFVEEENQYKNASRLLKLLNKTNLELVKAMFEKPMPHCTIRYHQIEGLFGKQEDGKLPGSITFVSGSHSKICIENSVGFFDDFSALEGTANKKLVKPPQEIVGGMFKPHKSGQGNSVLPRVAIRMVCSTLAKVGITAENLARFNSDQTNSLVL